MTVADRLAVILDKLNGVRQTSEGYAALCPAHPDSRPSLSVGPGHDGRILLRCFGGCTAEQIMAAIGLPMTMLFEGREHPAEPVHSPMRSETTDARPDAKVLQARRLYGEGVPTVGTSGGIYLESRGVAAELADQNGARFHPRLSCSVSGQVHQGPAVLFPMHSGQPPRRIVGVNARFLNPDRDTAGEKMRTHGKPSLGVFGTRGAQLCTEVLIVEAPIDALSLAAAGFPAFATCGANNLRYFPALMKGKAVACAFDMDSNPQTRDRIRSSIGRFKQESGGRVVWVKPPGGALKDWNDVLRMHGPEALARYLRDAGTKCRPPLFHGDSRHADPNGELPADVPTDQALVSDGPASPDRPTPPAECLRGCGGASFYLEPAAYDGAGAWICRRCSAAQPADTHGGMWKWQVPPA